MQVLAAASIVEEKNAHIEALIEKRDRLAQTAGLKKTVIDGTSDAKATEGSAAPLLDALTTNHLTHTDFLGSDQNNSSQQSCSEGKRVKPTGISKKSQIARELQEHNTDCGLPPASTEMEESKSARSGASAVTSIENTDSGHRVVRKKWLLSKARRKQEERILENQKLLAQISGKSMSNFRTGLSQP